MKKHQGQKQVKEDTLQFLGMTWRCNKHGYPWPHGYGLRVTNITGKVKAKCPQWGNLDMQGGRCLSPMYQQRCTASTYEGSEVWAQVARSADHSPATWRGAGRHADSCLLFHGGPGGDPWLHFPVCRPCSHGWNCLHRKWVYAGPWSRISVLLPSIYHCFLWRNW